MSKRRNRDRQPNIPTEALQRAREQAGLAPVSAANEEIDTPEVEAAPAATSTPASLMPTATASAAKRQRKVGSAQVNPSRKRGESDQEKIKYLLENPTKIVSEAELRAEYSHVLVDLRNMGLLAAVLIAALVALSLVL
jgi:hypothetical protein